MQLFAGVAKECAYKKIQNNTARLVTKTSKRDLITLLFKELHWLPVKYCIQDKLGTLAFRHFDGTHPLYMLSSLITYLP